MVETRGGHDGEGARLDAGLAAGTMVGDYRVESVLGEGGGGTVYAGVHPRIGKRVAIKVLRFAFAEDAAGVARFEREARAVNDIRHAGIVDVFAVGRLADGRPYLVMSRLEGRSLRAELQARQTLSWTEAWPLVRQVARALEAAHDAGVVHRDLKPDNVFLESARDAADSPLKTVKVLDFGLAKVDGESEGAAKLTRSGLVLGTPAYMAPEQWWNAEVDARTDQYALGIVLYEMLAGRTPFDAPRFVDLAQEHLHKAPPPFDASTASRLPHGAEPFVRRMLEKNADARFASMAHVVAAGDGLAPCATGGDPPRATLPPVAHGVSSSLPSAKPATPRRLPFASFTHRHDATAERVRVVVALALGIALVLGVGYAGPSRRDIVAWYVLAGWSGPAAVVLFALGIVVLLARVKARVEGRVVAVAAFLVATLPCLQGAIGAFTGGQSVAGAVHSTDRDPVQQLRILSEGMYELNVIRFTGFAISSILFVALASLLGSGRTPAPERVNDATPRTVAALALVAVALGAFVVQAPSAVYVPLVGAGALLAGRARCDAAGRGLVLQSAASVLAVACGLTAALVRDDAREAALWGAASTRAERVEEILRASAEHSATLAVGAVTLAAVLVLEVRRAMRSRVDVSTSSIASLRALVAPTRRAVAVAVVLAFAFGLDLELRAGLLAEHARMRSALAPRFALFARLNPPTADGLDGTALAAHALPALQLTRDVAALNAKGVAKVATLASDEGARTLRHEISAAVAVLDAPVAEPESANDAELSVTADARASAATLVRVLTIVRSAGVRRVELLMTRGASPTLPTTAPAEASYVLASDFVAVPVVLGDEGLAPSAGDAETYGAFAVEIQKRARTGALPVPIATSH